MAASIAGLELIAMCLGAPAIFVSGWLFLRHLVTLDDDMPDEWPPTNFHHGFGFVMRLLANAGTQSSRQQNSFHCRSLRFLKNIGANSIRRSASTLSY